MFRTNSYQLTAPSTVLVGVSLALCCVNYGLFILTTSRKTGSCETSELSHQDVAQEIQYSEPSHWQVAEQNEAWVVEMSKYKSFNWDDEMARLLGIIPVLEFHSNGSTADDDTQGNSTYKEKDLDTKSSKVGYATDKVHTDKITREIERINANYKSLYVYENGIEMSIWEKLRNEVFTNGILLCKDMETMEKNRVTPRLKYTFRTFTQWKGEIRSDSIFKFPVYLRRIERRAKPPTGKSYMKNYASIAKKGQVPYVDKAFEHAKNELLNLLRMQGWYGVPRLLGVCMASSHGVDVIESVLKKKGTAEPYLLTYLVSRHDDSYTKMCDDYIPSFQCIQAYPVLGQIKMNNNPGAAALRFMLNIATLFKQFQDSGAILYDFIGEEFLFNENFDVMITRFNTVHFLSRNDGSEQTDTGIDRMLSGTTCKLNQECAQALWQANSISYKFGLHCEETRGLCTDECRCWGLDSHVHVCIMSRWIFSQIRAVVPLAWTYSANVTGVVQCAAHGIPAERCDWTHVKFTLTELYQLALVELP